MHFLRVGNIFQNRVQGIAVTNITHIWGLMKTLLDAFQRFVGRASLALAVHHVCPVHIVLGLPHGLSQTQVGVNIHRPAPMAIAPIPIPAPCIGVLAPPPQPPQPPKPPYWACVEPAVKDNKPATKAGRIHFDLFNMTSYLSMTYRFHRPSSSHASRKTRLPTIGGRLMTSSNKYYTRQFHGKSNDYFLSHMNGIRGIGTNRISR